MHLALFVVPAVVVGVGLLFRRLPAERVARLSVQPPRWLPLALGAISTLIVLGVWGSVDQVPVIHDERAYVLQSEIFAGGHWTAPAPPIPAFFEQMHVLVTPRVAEKYAPGHALLMAPGTLLGMPGLVPLLLTGLAGMLVFVLARRIANPTVALLAWFFWSIAPENVSWRATYFSETTSTAAVLVAWWALLEWRATGARRMLLLVAFAVGWGAITRPLTMLAFAIPIGVVVLVRTIRQRTWRDLACATAVGVAVLGIIPLWSAETTGNWRLTPLTLYTNTYIPFDRLGFGLDSTPAARALPRDLHDAMVGFAIEHAHYTPATVPRAAVERVVALVVHTWRGWLAGLMVFAALSCTALSAELAFALLSIVLCLLAYLAYATSPGWTVYYLEFQPVLAFMTAVGIARVLRWCTTAGRSPAERSIDGGRAALAAAALILFAIVPAASDLAWLHDVTTQWTLTHRLFRAQLAEIPVPRALVFVRYAPGHSGHLSLVGNAADPATAHALTAYDFGLKDTALARAYPDRVPYIYDQSQLKLFRVAAPPRDH